MSRTLFTLLALIALATGLAIAQDQPAQNPSQSQPMPQTQQPSQPPQQPPAHQGQTGMSSQQLQAAFERTFQRYPELSDVKIKVADDKIEFSGTVPNQADKDRVHRTAEANADGRKIMDDDLKVSGNANKPLNEKPPMSEQPRTPPPSNPPPR